MAIIYLGIGSNLGNREENIFRALSLLKKHGIKILRCSTLIETAPVGGPSHQNNYLNGVAQARTRLIPLELLRHLKIIEQQLGRTKTVVNGPRPIDLDILLYDQLVLHSDPLTIPHPRMLERDFVMSPLKEIAPQLAEELMHAHH